MSDDMGVRIAPEILAEILAHPDDDAPRLRYADALEAAGERDRGEYIRLECELTRRQRPGERPSPEERAELDALGERASEIEQRSAHAWSPSWPNSASGRPLARGYYRRGFLDKLQAQSAEFVPSAAAFFALHPIREVEMTADCVGIADVPGFERVRRLSVTGGLDVASFERLVAGRHLGALESISLEVRSGHGDGVAAAFASSAERFPRLDYLGLGRCDLGVEAARALARVHAWPRLRGLDLYDNPRLGAEGVGVLAASTLVSTVEYLRLYGNDLGPDAGAALAAGRFDKLGDLNLRSNRLGAEGLAALLHSSAFPKLTQLALMNNRLDDDALEPFRDAALARQLESLELDENSIGDAGAALLASSEALARLRSLGMRATCLTKAGYPALAARFPHVDLGWQVEPKDLPDRPPVSHIELQMAQELLAHGWQGREPGWFECTGALALRVGVPSKRAVSDDDAVFVMLGKRHPTGIGLLVYVDRQLSRLLDCVRFLQDEANEHNYVQYLRMLVRVCPLTFIVDPRRPSEKPVLLVDEDVARLVLHADDSDA